MRVASLFTGAGGLDIGLEQLPMRRSTPSVHAQAGHTIILQCEIDPGAQQVLKQRFPGTLLVPDVCSLVALPEETEVLAAGFPCIDVSRAGLRRGLDGQSTSLVRHVFRLLETTLKENRGIPWVLLENVEGLLDRINGQPPVIQYIVEQFERLGYSSWAHRIIHTASFGAPNRRKRVFVLASLHGDARDVLLSQGTICKGACYQLFSGKPCYSCHQADSPEANGETLNCTYAMDLANAQSGPVIDMVPTFKTGNGRICLLLSNGQLGALTTEDAERLQGFEPGHTLACFPLRGPGASLHGAPSLRDTDVDRRDSHRWALLGNAVSVPVAAWLGQRLANPHRHKYYLGTKDRKLVTSHAGNPRGGLQKRVYEWADEDDILMPDNELFEFNSGDASGEEAGEEGAASAATEAVPKTESSELAEKATHSTVAAMQIDNAAADEEAGADEEAAGDKQRQLDFQFDIVRQQAKKKAQGQLSAGLSAVQVDDSSAWPRAAWYIKGLGRFAIEAMSEAPMLMPLTLLGDFISKVGRPPEKEALTTYFARLREQGFNMEDVVKRAQQCGASLNQEAVRITRLPGYTPDLDTLGTLCWARTPGGAWWPGEALDPFHLPPTRSIPALAAAALTSAEYQASIHKRSGQAPPPMRIGSAVGDGTAAAEPGIEETAPAADAPRTPMLRASTAPGKRKVLVILFGERSCMWQSPAQLLPFKRHLHEKLAEGNALIDAKKMPRPALFTRAVQEAKGLAGMLAAVARGGAEAAEGPHQEALAALAATRAAAANLRARCGSCEACLSTGGPARRCLVNRAAAAAAAGHSGAQVAVTGDRAIGARMSVWWPTDEEWYSGYVTAFDPLRQRHTVFYDDGDVEILALWAPNELVRVETNPDEWPAEAERITKDWKDFSAAHLAKKRARRATAPEPAAAASAEPLSWFEQQRMENIARNHSMLADLGLAAPPAPAAAAAAALGPAPAGAGAHGNGAGKKKSPSAAGGKGDSGSVPSAKRAKRAQGMPSDARPAKGGSGSSGITVHVQKPDGNNGEVPKEVADWMQI